MLRLVARFEQSVRQWPYPSGEQRLGSAADNDLVISFSGAPGVSRHHAHVRPVEEGLLVADTGSKNGLWQAGRRFDVVVLRAGEEVRLGKVRLAVEEVSTSDFLLAMGPTEIASPPAGESQATSAATNISADDEQGAAFRVIRRIETLSPGERMERRQELLEACRAAMAAEGMVAFTMRGDEIVLSGASGRAPLGAETEALRNLARGLAQDSRWQISAAESPASESFAAFFPAGPKATWHRDFLGFVASRLVAVDPKAAPIVSPAADAAQPPDNFVAATSRPMTELLRRLAEVAPMPEDVLLVGETGTGKEVCARMIHQGSPRSKGPFVAINCAAIPESMLEAELFGVKQGAATGVSQRKGIFTRASGGTVFLDEVSELSPGAQAKLLRVLQEREVLAVGSDEPSPLDLRVIAATNADLEDHTKQGRFRRDLFFRLWRVVLRVPPLRERREDIPALVFAFTRSAAHDFGKTIAGVSSKALEMLRAHPWEGNVRELENAVRAAVAKCADGGVLESGAFELAFRESVAVGAKRTTNEPPEDIPLSEKEQQTARSAILGALERTSWNKTAAARLLGLTRQGLGKKLKRLGLDELKARPRKTRP